MLPHVPLSAVALPPSVAVPPAPHQLLVEIEEISRHTAIASHRLFLTANCVEEILRARLYEEANRYCSEPWAEYKQYAWEVETLLSKAGVADEVVRRAMMRLDEAAVGLYVVGQAEMLDLGLDVGRQLATRNAFSVMMPGARICDGCAGGGGQHQGVTTRGRIGDDAVCPVCQGAGVVDPGPELLLLYYPDAPVELEDVTAPAA